MISVWSSWCHYHPIISCFIKIQNGLHSRCWLTRLSGKEYVIHCWKLVGAGAHITVVSECLCVLCVTLTGICHFCCIQCSTAWLPLSELISLECFVHTPASARERHCLLLLIMALYSHLSRLLDSHSSGQYTSSCRPSCLPRVQVDYVQVTSSRKWWWSNNLCLFVLSSICLSVPFFLSLMWRTWGIRLLIVTQQGSASDAVSACWGLMVQGPRLLL